MILTDTEIREAIDAANLHSGATSKDRYRIVAETAIEKAAQACEKMCGNWMLDKKTKDLICPCAAAVRDIRVLP
ncbi:MAG: hypothetical protein U0990_10000 [Candidatus Nanopelagicales bacterium]|nr:hypothetical protein [Candidatus Nanopelagicales bacterium]